MRRQQNQQKLLLHVLLYLILQLIPKWCCRSPGYKWLQKATTQKDPKSEDVFFLNSYLWTVNFLNINKPLKFMC